MVLAHRHVEDRIGLMVDVSVSELQRLSQLNFGLDYPGGLRAATGLQRDPNGVSQFLTSQDLNASADALYSLLGGGGIPVAGGLVMPTPTDLSNARADTPDVAALDILGDIEVRTVVTMWDWTPGGANTLANKWTEAGNQRSWLFRMQATGVPIWNWSVDGIASLQIPGDPTAPVTPLLVGNGGKLGVGVRFDVNNGAAGRTATFITSIDGVTWVVLGAPQTTATVTSIFNSTSPLMAGGRSDSVQTLSGIVHSLEVRNLIGGTVVANPNFAAATPGVTSFVDSTGKTWTVQGNARVA